MKRAHRTAHARIWTVLGILLPLAFFTILALRQTPPPTGLPYSWTRLQVNLPGRPRNERSIHAGHLEPEQDDL